MISRVQQLAPVGDGGLRCFQQSVRHATGSLTTIILLQMDPCKRAAIPLLPLQFNRSRARTNVETCLEAPAAAFSNSGVRVHGGCPLLQQLRLTNSASTELHYFIQQIPPSCILSPQKNCFQAPSNKLSRAQHVQ